MRYYQIKILYLENSKMCRQQVLWYVEATRLFVKMISSLLKFTGTPASP